MLLRYARMRRGLTASKILWDQFHRGQEPPEVLSLSRAHSMLSKVRRKVRVGEEKEPSVSECRVWGT